MVMTSHVQPRQQHRTRWRAVHYSTRSPTWMVTWQTPPINPRIPCVSKNMDASCRRKSNGKRTGKRTRPICFERGNAVCNGIMFNFYQGLLAVLHFIPISTTLLASSSTILEVEHPSGDCWSSLQYSFSPVFTHLALLQDSFIDVF